MRDCLSSEEEKRNNCYEMVDLEGEKMPIVHVNVWEGFGKEKIKTVIQGITKIFVDLGVPEYAVEVIVHEIPKSNWGIGGVPASEKFKDIS
jgi:4-oxalocrotonate tautomerase